MAHGDLIDSVRAAGGSYFTTHLLVDRAKAAGEGPWVDVRGFRSLSLDVEGLVDGALVLRGSNAKGTPVGAGHQVGEAITADGLVALALSVCWLRCDVVTPNHAEVTAILHAVA